MAEAAAVESHEFQAETKELLGLVINSLYTHKEVFLRELISNASDACDKARIRALTEHEVLGDDKDFEVVITPDKEAKTLTIEDNGVGMTREELQANLGTIAKSGSKEFMRALSGDAKQDAALIGQFGVGFYSGFLVADLVEVTSRGAGASEAWTWSSKADGRFELRAGERARRGTAIVLHLKEDQLEYLEGQRLRHLVKRYSDFVGHPIKLIEEVEEEGEEGEESTTTTNQEVINAGSALWRRPKSELTDEQYNEFFKTLGNWEDPLRWTHFQVEGMQQFTGLLYVPKRAPFDMFHQDRKSGVRLYVKRVFVMDECDTLLPEYLRFVRGVVDSDDLPLNVSREVLQEDQVVRGMRKALVKKVLSLLEEMAKEDDGAYLEFWEQFGAVLKEGMHSDFTNRDRLQELLRFPSSKGEGLVSLAQYKERMVEGQEAIYTISGPSREFLDKSPHIEGLKAKGYEVLYLVDPIDEWVAQSLTEYDGTKVVSAMKGELSLDGEDTDSEGEAPEDGEFKTLIEKIQGVLGERVKAVRTTQRLTDSPVCLVAGEHDLGANLERILKSQGGGAQALQFGGGQRTLELNAKHPLILSLKAQAEGETGEDFGSWAELLYDQALLTEGSAIADPAGFAQRMNKLLLKVSGS